MEKINIFVILAYKEQTYKYFRQINTMLKRCNEKKKTMETTLLWHYFVLAKYCNIHNFYEYKEDIASYEHPLIYHLPYGKDSLDTEVEKELLKFKGRVPIIMRSYDPHSPMKTSKEYMDKYHDVAFTYLNKHANGKNRIYTNICYDNHLAYLYDTVPKERKLACMILRKEARKEYHEPSVNFKKKGLSLVKTYHLREKITMCQQVDIYGRNWPLNMGNYRGTLSPHMKKYQILNKYKFNIIVENAIVDNYLSEKLLDAFVALCVPVYLGAPKAHKWIPRCCYIDMNRFENEKKLLTYLENMSDQEYYCYIENIHKLRKEIFDTFSTKNTSVLPLLLWYKENYRSRLSVDRDEFDKIEAEVRNLKFFNYVKLGTRLKTLIMECKLSYNKLVKNEHN